VTEQKYEIGMVGLGVMGRNLVLNIADHGFSVSGYDNDQSKVQELKTEAGSGAINAAQSLKDFVSVLSTPRAIMMLVPAGQVVDNVIHELIPQLERGDLIIDAGNSHSKIRTCARSHWPKKASCIWGLGFLAARMATGMAPA
jgi:6-phosphogluconate dehydrogenase